MTTVRRVPDDHPSKNKETGFPVTGSAAEEALDAMDDDEVGIDGFDEDDEDDLDLGPPQQAQAPRVVAVPVVEPARRAPKKPPPRQARPAGPGQGVLQQAAKAQQELEEFIGGLAFGEDQHRIIVNRLEPTHDPKTGENITGTLKTYYMPIGVEELQKAFGGGLYELMIMGPDPMSGRKISLRKRDKIRIAGKPRLDSDFEEERRKEQSDPRADLFVKALESKEREVERLAKEARDAQRLLLEQALKPKDDGALLATVMSLVKEQQSKADSSVAALMQAMREDRKADEERRREEARRDEERRKEEREEARRQREMEERRWQAEEAARTRQHEKELAMLESRSKSEAAESGKMTEVMLKFMEASRKEEQDRARYEKQRQDELSKMQFETMQAASKQSSEMAMSSARFQMELMAEALKEAKTTKKGGIGEMAAELLAVQQLTKELRGEGDEPEQSTAEKILDRVEAFVPSLATAAAGFMSARQQQAHAAPQLPPAPTRMALVDQGPAYGNAPPALTQPAPQPRNALVELPQPQPIEDPFAAVEQPQEAPVAASDANDFTSYVFPKKGADSTEVVTCMLKSIDWGVQQGKTAEEIADEVLPHYVKEFGMIVFMLRKASADELVKFVEERVPQTWALSSPNGEKILRELHEIANET